MSMKGINLPMTFIIFIILLLIIATIIILWHFAGFEIFTETTENVTNGLIEEISGGRVS